MLLVTGLREAVTGRRGKLSRFQAENGVHGDEELQYSRLASTASRVSLSEGSTGIGCSAKSVKMQSRAPLEPASASKDYLELLHFRARPHRVSGDHVHVPRAGVSGSGCQLPSGGEQRQAPDSARVEALVPVGQGARVAHNGSWRSPATSSIPPRDQTMARR